MGMVIDAKDFGKLSTRLLRWIKVSANGCFLWTGGRMRGGYGGLWLDRRKWTAHRLAYTIWRRPIPAGLFVCHHCDTPSCINPAHLFLGTQADNLQDAKRKGRTASGLRSGPHTHPERLERGEKHWNSKLTQRSVAEIRARYPNGETLHSLARKFGVSPATISRVVNHLIWKQ